LLVPTGNALGIVFLQAVQLPLVTSFLSGDSIALAMQGDRINRYGEKVWGENI